MKIQFVFCEVGINVSKYYVKKFYYSLDLKTKNILSFTLNTGVN
jgi:hypothetical protein